MLRSILKKFNWIDVERALNYIVDAGAIKVDIHVSINANVERLSVLH